MSTLTVRLVTTWNTGCGIAEHSAMLKEAVEAADSSITIMPDAGALDPAQFFAGHDWVGTDMAQILHLNYHAALHSRWAVEDILRAKAIGLKVIITYHDTIGEISPADLRAVGDTRLDRVEQFDALADALIVHEPCAGLPCAIYWRMGVAAPESPREILRSRWTGQPILGSIGFPFPWKNYDELARLTGEIGWGLYLIAPNAMPADVARWRTYNPDLSCRTDFVPRREAIALLAGCDATAFPYTCANTAQSGAILQGVATRKPVIAFSGCRQFRSLYLDPLGREAIRWCRDFDELAYALRTVSIERCDPGIVALAEQDSWAKLGQQYASLYHTVAAGGHRA